MFLGKLKIHESVKALNGWLLSQDILCAVGEEEFVENVRGPAGGLVYFWMLKDQCLPCRPPFLLLLTSHDD